jgi:protein-tyrosine phosphatase
MVDLHCHLLPGIDDGPETLAEALALADHAVAAGIARSVVTPHILPGRYENTLSGIREATARFRAQLRERGIPLEIGYAAEIRIGPDILTLADEGALPILGTVDGYGIVLLEFPDSHILPGSARLVAAMLERKLRPLVAHPERNKAVMHDIDKIGPFVRSGCWLQLTAASITGAFGPRCLEASRQMLQRGWVTVLASDAHNRTARVPELESGRRAAEKIVGEKASWPLVRETPAQITADNIGLAPASPAGRGAARERHS